MMNLCKASKTDAEKLAILINSAGEGVPNYLWGNMAKNGQTALEVGTQRAGRDEGGFSYTNATLCKQHNEILGMLIAYKLDDPYETGDLDDYPDFIRPLIVLESQAPGSWYINALATFESHQGKGVARQLLAHTEHLAIDNGCDKLSLIVSSENERACGLYESIGYRQAGQAPVVACPGILHGGYWKLMIKQLH